MDKLLVAVAVVVIVIMTGLSIAQAVMATPQFQQLAGAFK